MLIEEAYLSCKEIMEEHSKTFSKAFQYLPKRKRRAVWAIYAFCRTVDDIVDEGQDPHKELEVFKEELDTFAKGSLKEDSFLWVALKDTFDQFDFDLQPFYDMVKGQGMDLYKKRYGTVEEMKEYAYYVASTVGIMLLPILSPRNKVRLHSSAVNLGIAMQITNILRDIGEDMERGRTYLPQELLHKYQYTEEMLRNGEVNERFIGLWEELAEMAEEYYEEALAFMGLYPIASRLPVESAAQLYRGILASVRENNYDVFQKRAFVNLQQKERIMSMIGKGS